MSIIYEALKKVEATSQSGNSRGVSPPQKIHTRFKPYYIYIPAIGIGFFAGALLFNLFIHPKKNSAPISAQVSITPPVVSVDAAIPKKEPRPLPVLNGIFSSQNEGYALINNLIVKEGDEIEGATVVSISPDSVELKFGDSVIKLSNQEK